MTSRSGPGSQSEPPRRPAAPDAAADPVFRAAGDGQPRALVGGERHVPEAAAGVLEVEGEAAPGSAAGSRPPRATIWWFRPHGAPRPLETADPPQVVARDENFA